jgi:ribosomal protein S18 acetylase RimI-like enzyme
MIDVRDDREIDLRAFARLRERCAFDAKPLEFLAALVAGSHWIAHAHDAANDDRLVGFVRAISDGVATAYLSTLMVDPEYRRRGIGRAMVQRITHGRDEVKFALHSRHEAIAFFASVGFVPATDMMVRERR